MQKMIEEYMDKYQIDSISVCMHQYGKEVFSYSSGLISQHSKKTVQADTRFTIGSISKLFVSVAILQLIEKGILSMQTPVCQIIDEFKYLSLDYQQITVEMLLSHSSGLSSTSFRGKYTNHYYPQYVSDMLQMYKQLPLKSKPGKYSVYCNDGFVLAQYIVEILTQMSFYDYCHQFIFNVAKMEDTSLPPKIMEETSFAHAKNDYDLDFNQEYVNGIGSGGIYSTSKDICLFLDALMNGILLSKKNFEIMRSHHHKSHIHSIELNGSEYGLGFDHVEMPYFKAMGKTAIAKGGATFGYMSYTLSVLEEGLSIAILSTSKEAGVTMLAKELVNHYLNIPSMPMLLTIPKQAKDISGYYGASNRTYCIEIENDIKVTTFHQGVFDSPIYFKKIGEEYQCDHMAYGFMQPKIGFVEENNETYMYLVSMDGLSEVRFLLAQKIHKAQDIIEDFSTSYIKINEHKDQRTFYTQDLQLIKPTLLKGYNTILVPFPLRVIDKNKAISFVELPGNYAREMCQVSWSGKELALGNYRYCAVESLIDLPASILLDNLDTKWYLYSNNKQIIAPESTRVVGMDEQGQIIYDSLYCLNIDEEKIMYIGFLGEVGDRIEIV